MSKQLFVSYATADTAITEQIRDYLEGSGVACWMAPRDIAPGEDYAEQIIAAIETCRVLLLVLSESSNHSQYVRNELERAVAKRKVVIPFRIHDVQPSRSLEFFISNAQWIDAWQGPLTLPLESLTAAIRTHLASITQIPAHSVAPPSPPRHNLPHELTRFIGRERELEALDQLLADPEVRLITILGPGGMGKTRLSLALAKRHLSDPRFADGVYFVALAPLSEAQHIVLTLTDVLALLLQPGADTQAMQQQLLEYLRSKRMLPVLDNFEHLLDRANLVVQILRAAAQVQIVVTTRERLRVPGEHLFPIQGLEYAGAADTAAVRLFLQSAQQLQPDLHLNEGEIMQVTDICRLVGGMPLGIELAASWSEVLSPAEIAAEIQRSLDFLETEQRGGIEQHRSMRAVLDSTWQRLEPVEQAVLARLSTFRGGFTREAAERVAGASVRLLGALPGKSLVQYERERERYTLHELLRQFAQEKLVVDASQADETYARHGAFYTTFLEQQGPRLKGREHVQALAAMEAEIENIRTAWQWLVTHRDAGSIDRTLEALAVFYFAKTWFQEGVASFGRAASALHMDEPAGKQGVLLGKLLTLQGWMLTEIGFNIQGYDSLDGANVLFQRSLEILGKLGARKELAHVLACLSWHATHRGDKENAVRLGQQALDIFIAAPDPWIMSWALISMSTSSTLLGQYTQGIDYARRAILISEDADDLHSLGEGLFFLGNSLFPSGDYEAAKVVLHKCLAVTRATGDKRINILAMQLLGDIAWQAGDYVAARHHAQECLTLAQELGLTRFLDPPRILLGNIACGVGDYLQARSYFLPILASYLKANILSINYWGAAPLLGMATVLAKEGKTVQAMEVLTHVLHLAGAPQDAKVRAARLLAEVMAETPILTAPMVRPLEVVVAELLNE